jgi:ATP-dependent helicase/DNAse subunit B
VLHLEAVDDAAAELDALSFGSLMHDVLLDFAKSELRDSSDEEEIRLVLRDALDRRAASIYGDHALTPVEIQIEQMRTRLEQFARVQADWAAQGWMIERAEIDAQHAIEVDGRPIVLHGRIDRIDRHRETGQRMVIDYKSGDKAGPPDDAHRKAGQWVDLQLPLYRHLVRGLQIEGPVGLAYLTLPKDAAAAGVHVATWTDADLAGADELFFGIVRNIRNEVFWPPAEKPPYGGDDFSVICQDGVFDKSPQPEEAAAR